MLKVSPEVLISTAEEFESEAGIVGGLTSSMIDIVNGIPSSWMGEASTAYISKFNGLQDDIQRIVNMIREHSQDLNTMAQAYITTETEAAEMAQTLSSDVIV